jgi:hypothetical protein
VLVLKKGKSKSKGGKSSYKVIAGAIGGGVLVTLVSGLVNITPSGLVGSRWYGFPASWISRLVLAPQYNPWRINAVGLAIDLVVWILIVGAILVIIKHFKK